MIFVADPLGICDFTSLSLSHKHADFAVDLHHSKGLGNLKFYGMDLRALLSDATDNLGEFPISFSLEIDSSLAWASLFMCNDK